MNKMNIMQIKEIERLQSDLEKRYLAAKATGTIDYLSLNLIDAENLVSVLTLLCNYAREAIDWTPVEVGFERDDGDGSTNFFLFINGSKTSYTLTDDQLIEYNENDILESVSEFLAVEYKNKIKSKLNNLNVAIKNAQLVNLRGGK